MHQIVEDMLAAQYREHEFDLYIEEEIEKLPPCEMSGHADGGDFHEPEKHAEFWVISPCGLEKMACARWVRMGARTAATECRECGVTHSNNEYTYIPLDIRRG